MITLREIYNRRGGVTVEDVGFLYHLLGHRTPQESLSHKAMPSMRDHTTFVNGRPYAHWFIIENEGTPIGQIHLTERNEIGISLCPEARGQGYGMEALRTFVAQVKPLPAIPSQRVGAYLANINPKNDGSMRFFERAGFKLKQVTYQL